MVSSTKEGGGARIHFQGPNGEDLSYAITLDFVITNNEAEYEALIAGLEMALKAKVKSITVLTDSELVHRQVKGIYEAKEFNMIKDLEKPKSIISQFEKFDIQPIPREENLWADLLSKFTGVADGKNERIITWLLSNTPAIDLDVTPCINIMEVNEQNTSWIDPFVSYLQEGKLPEDSNEARRIKYRSPSFSLIDDKLYKRSSSGILLKCVSENQYNTILNEIHDGEAGNHDGARALALKCSRTGYYWPTFFSDSVDYLKKCHHCQIHSILVNREIVLGILAMRNTAK